MKRWWNDIVLAIGVLLFWFFLGPSAIHGPMTYITTKGISMQPMLHQGDLAVVRRSSNYKVGDIAAYRSKELGAVVLHRIIAMDGSRYVFKGDNNSWIDNEHPEKSALLGTMATHIGGFGDVMQKAKSPVGVAVLVGLVSALFMTRKARSGWRDARSAPQIAGTGPGRRAPAGTRAPAMAEGPGVAAYAGSSGHEAPRGRDPHQEAWWVDALRFHFPVARWALAGAAGLTVLLGLAAVTRPATTTATVTITTEHRGEFSYRATAKGGEAVYPRGVVRSGDPVFLKLAKKIRLDFSYKFDVDKSRIESIKGTSKLRALLRSPDGWAQVIPLKPVQTFTGTMTSLSADIDLAALRSKVDRAAEITGVSRDPVTLYIQPEIALQGTIAGNRIDDVFSPQLSFDLGGLSARLMEAVPSPSGTPTGGLTQSKGSSVEATIAKPGTLKLAFLSLSAKTLRTVGMLLAVLSLLGAAFIMFTITRRGPLTRMETIEARYGMLLIDGRASQDLRPSLVVVKTINDLAKIAEHHGGMIVHEDSTDRHWFRVDAGDTTYGYSFRTARTRPSPGPRQAATRLAVP